MSPHDLTADASSVVKAPTSNDGSKPLKILVVGAGIAGLAAAIGLRRAGHQVEV